MADEYGTSVPQLLKLNPTLEKNPDLVMAHSWIVVPDGSADTTAGEKQIEVAVHTVHLETARMPAGSTLGAFAQAHGTSVDRILEFNPQIKDANFVAAGQLITLPPQEQQFNHPLDVAHSLLGKTSTEIERVGPLADVMENWVDDRTDCASFVTASLIESGWLQRSQYASGVLLMEDNLRADPDWIEVDLQELRPGDVIVLSNSGEAHAHTVLFLGFDVAGDARYIGSNNLTKNGPQVVSYGVADLGSYTTGFSYQVSRAASPFAP